MLNASMLFNYMVALIIQEINTPSNALPYPFPILNQGERDYNTYNRAGELYYFNHSITSMFNPRLVEGQGLNTTENKEKKGFILHCK